MNMCQSPKSSSMMMIPLLLPFVHHLTKRCYHHCLHKPILSLISCLSTFSFHNRSPSINSSATAKSIAVYLTIAMISIICYCNSLNGDFVHDDIPAIVQNPDVLGTTSIWQLFQNDFWGRPMSDPESHKSYRPITTLTFRLNMMISVHPFGFHFVNLVLHTIVSLLVCGLTSRIFRFDGQYALLAGALFATHPIHCEAVSSIVGRADVLCALFYLSAFLAFHLSLQSSLSFLSQIVFLSIFVLQTTLALLSKEIGITILGVCAFHWWCWWSRIITIDRSFKNDINQNQLIQTRRPLSSLLSPIITIILSFFILMTFRLRILGDTLPFFSDQDNPASHSKSSLTRILTYLYLAVFNVQLLISPKQQAYDWQTSSIRLIQSWTDCRNMATLFLLLTSFLLFYRVLENNVIARRKTNSLALKENHTLSLSIMFLVMPYLPASNLFITVGFVVAERLLYIPSIGFICLICFGLKQLENEKSNNMKQWTNDNKCYMRCYRLLINSRLHYLSRLVLFLLVCPVFVMKTIQQNRVWSSRESLYKSGIVNVPENAKAHYNYGNLQQDIGNWDDAMYHYQTAIRLWPEHASAHNNLGALFWKISKPDHAEKHFVKALKINPYHAKAHFNLGKVYSKRGQTSEAIRLMERSIRLDRKFGESYEALAALYAHLGQLTLAERFYSRAIRLRPRNADFYNNYGAFLQKTGRFEYARRHYQRALELKPSHQIALVNMANLLTILHRFDEAEYFYKRAMKLKKDLATLDSLGTLYLRRSKLDLARHVYQSLWAKYSLASTATTAEKSSSNVSVAEEQKNQQQNHMLPANIHYAQLLILEGRFGEAEVLLEALTTRFNTQNNNDKDGHGHKEKESDQQQHWTTKHFPAMMDGKKQPIRTNSLTNENIPTTLKISSFSTGNENNRNNIDNIKQDIPLSSNHFSYSKYFESSSFRIDVFHQLALLYTLTNRTVEALDSIRKALKLCRFSSFSSKSSVNASPISMQSDVFNYLTSQCAQILTLQGDIQKDFHQWTNAIQSYKQALQLDECLPRAHLHLAVIYHLDGEYPQAMLHYSLAQQLDQHSSNRKLINENIAKLRFRIQRLMIHDDSIDDQAKNNQATSESTTNNHQHPHSLSRHCKSRYLITAYTRPHQHFHQSHSYSDNTLNQNSLEADSSSYMLITAPSDTISSSQRQQMFHHQHSNSNVLSLSSSILSSY